MFAKAPRASGRPIRNIRTAVQSIVMFLERESEVTCRAGWDCLNRLRRGWSERVSSRTLRRLWPRCGTSILVRTAPGVYSYHDATVE